MEQRGQAEALLSALEERVYSELISLIRESSASSSQKRVWLDEAMQALCEAEDILSSGGTPAAAAPQTARIAALCAMLRLQKEGDARGLQE